MAAVTKSVLGKQSGTCGECLETTLTLLEMHGRDGAPQKNKNLGESGPSTREA